MFVTTDATLDDHEGVVLHLVGELDSTFAPEARQHFDDALAWGFGPITIDCADVTFLDAGGLGALVHVSNGALAQSRTVVLRDVNPRISRVIEAGGLARLLAGEERSGVPGLGSRISSAT